jgi:hypothetical protein
MKFAALLILAASFIASLLYALRLLREFSTEEGMPPYDPAPDDWGGW